MHVCYSKKSPGSLIQRPRIGGGGPSTPVCNEWQQQSQRDSSRQQAHQKLTQMLKKAPDLLGRAARSCTHRQLRQGHQSSTVGQSRRIGRSLPGRGLRSNVRRHTGWQHYKRASCVGYTALYQSNNRLMAMMATRGEESPPSPD